MGIDTKGGRPADQQQDGGTPGAGGGSGGSGGGYATAQNQQNHQGQAGHAPTDPGASPGQSRGERHDEAQGGGRGPDSVSAGAGAATDGGLAEDQAAHQDRGQSIAEEEQAG
jgi:hypothetical protein